MRKVYKNTTQMQALKDFIDDCKHQGVCSKLVSMVTLDKNSKSKKGSFELYTRKYK